jgi:1-acyl-sn-glycerol-3-phosphate acyltransferase
MVRRLYRKFVLALGRFLGFVYVREYIAEGKENVPKDGGLIVVSNHLNNADPPFIALALGRPPIFMAKKEMLKLPIVGPLFRAWGTFPVRRGEADIAALREATNVVNRGEMLFMFPEGTRSRDAKLAKGHPGTALIALRTGAPILPVAITGTEGVKWPAIFLKPRSVKQIKVVVGEPFTLERPARVNTEAAIDGTATIMRHIADLLPPEYRGVYADGASPE